MKHLFSITSTNNRFVSILGITFVIFILMACTNSKPSMEIGTEPDRPPMTERMIGTWISADLGYPMKIVIDNSGRKEYYISIIDPLPGFWMNYDIEKSSFDNKGIEWLSMNDLCGEPFSVGSQIETYSILSVSGDGTQMIHGFDFDSHLTPESVPDFIQKFYREGSEKANNAVDIASESAYVIVDRSVPACLLFYGIPDEETLELLKDEIPDENEIDIYKWADFVPLSVEITDAFVIHDDYEYPILVPGLIAVLRSYPLMEISVTWNKGIAFTMRDYILAEEFFERYSEDAEEYHRTKVPYDYTHNPIGHFQGLLGW